MDVQHELSKEAAAARALLLSCKEALGDDEQAIADTVEGETNLVEAIGAAVMRLNELAAHSDGLGAYIKAMHERVDRFEAQTDRIRQAIANAMDAGGLKKVELPHATLSLRAAAEKLGAVNEADIPARFFVDQAPKLDRRALLAELKAGTLIPGASLANGAPSLSVRVK